MADQARIGQKRPRDDEPPLLTPVRTMLPVEGVQCVLHTSIPGQMFLATLSAIWFWCQDLGVLSLLAGNRTDLGFRDGKGGEARFDTITSMIFFRDNNILLCDSDNQRIRHVTRQGKVTTVLGSGWIGHSDGTGANCGLDSPFSLAVSSMGVVYVSDTGNHRICRIECEVEPGEPCEHGEWKLETVAGGDGHGHVDADFSEAKFWAPGQLALTDYDNTLAAIEPKNHSVRAIDMPHRVASTLDANAHHFKGVVRCGAHLVTCDIKRKRLVMLEDGRPPRKVADLAGCTLEHHSESLTLWPAPDGFSLILPPGYMARSEMLTYADPSGLCKNRDNRYLCGIDPLPRKIRCDLQQSWEAMFDACMEDPAAGDIVFTLPDGTRMAAHKLVVGARSEYFKKGFEFHPEQREFDIKYEAVTPAVFKALLRFLYTADVPRGDVSVFDLVRVADYYQVDLLVDHCIDVFRASLSPRNVVQRVIETHDFALEWHDSGLEAMQVHCWNFLKAHAREIKVTTLVAVVGFCVRFADRVFINRTFTRSPWRFFTCAQI